MLLRIRHLVCLPLTPLTRILSATQQTKIWHIPHGGKWQPRSSRERPRTAAAAQTSNAARSSKRPPSLRGTPPLSQASNLDNLNHAPWSVQQPNTYSVQRPSPRPRTPAQLQHVPRPASVPNLGIAARGRRGLPPPSSPSEGLALSPLLPLGVTRRRAAAASGLPTASPMRRGVLPFSPRLVDDWSPPEEPSAPAPAGPPPPRRPPPVEVEPAPAPAPVVKSQRLDFAGKRISERLLGGGAYGRASNP